MPFFLDPHDFGGGAHINIVGQSLDQRRHSGLANPDAVPAHRPGILKKRGQFALGRDRRCTMVYPEAVHPPGGEPPAEPA